MLLFLICIVIYLLEAIRSEITIWSINHKLSRITDKRLSRWMCLIWPYTYAWLTYRKTKVWKSVAKFLVYKEPE